MRLWLTPIFKFLGLILVTLICIHFLYAAAASIYVASLDGHRLANIRNFPVSAWRGLTSAFASRHQNVETLFVGSSFTWGYAWNEDVVFTSYFSNALNMSVIAISPDGSIEILANARTIDADRVVFEINPSNMGSDLPIFSESLGNPERRSYFGVFLTQPFGVDIVKIGYNQYEYDQKEREYRQPPLPNDYFLDPSGLIESRVRERLSAIANLGHQIADLVYLFYSPQIFSSAPGNLREAYDRLYDVCKQEPRLICIDTRGFQDKANFTNVSHLNIRGHAAFAEFLKGELGL